MLLWPREDFYSKRRPTAADALLAVEVSDSSLRFDRQIKAPLYARHGVPELWLVDLVNHKLYVHRKPVDGNYSEVFASEPPHVITLALLDVSVDVTRMLEL